MKTALVRTVGALCAALAFTRPVGAQQYLSISPGALSADHNLMGAPMYGAGLDLDLTLLDSSATFRIGLSRYAGSNNRLGNLCTGLIRPDQDCSPIPVRDNFSLLSAEAGVALSLFHVGQVGVSALLSGHLGMAKSETRSTNTAGMIDGSRAMLGVSGGLGASWKPSVRTPVAVEGRVQVGFLDALGENGIVDGYTPFDGDAFRLTRITLGLSYKLPSKKR